MLTTVGERCGIAAYSAALAQPLRGLVDLHVDPIQSGRQSTDHYRDQAERLNAADVIHIQHEHAFWGGILPGHSAFWEMRYLLKKPVVVTAHTTSSLCVLLRVDAERRTVHRIAKELLLFRRGYRDSVETAPFATSRCIVHTHAAKRELIGRGVTEGDLHVLPAGIPEEPRDPTNGEAFRARHGLGDRKVISLFGYIAPNKGYELMLEALPKLDPSIAFVIAGGVRTPDMEPYAKQLAEDIRAKGLQGRVITTGYLSDSEVAEAMAASDLVIAPHTLATGSYSITLPIAHGRPVLASDLDCFRELNEAGKCVELFPAGSAEALASVIQRLLNSPSDLSALSSAASHHATNHTWRAVAEETVKIYDLAIADQLANKHSFP